MAPRRAVASAAELAVRGAAAAASVGGRFPWRRDVNSTPTPRQYAPAPRFSSASKVKGSSMNQRNNKAIGQ